MVSIKLQETVTCDPREIAITCSWAVEILDAGTQVVPRPQAPPAFAG
jgi:hypothetical protein